MIRTVFAKRACELHWNSTSSVAAAPLALLPSIPEEDDDV